MTITLTAELKRRLETYYGVDDEAELPSVTEAVLERKLADVHSETDDELIEELRSKPLPEVRDRDFESDFEEMHDTDEELDNLYNARQYVEKKIKSDEFFNMDDDKWNKMIKKAVDNGHLGNMNECENILEDMLHWDKLLPGQSYLSPTLTLFSCE
jgi:small subunit ribosomal protein S35